MAAKKKKVDPFDIQQAPSIIQNPVTNPVVPATLTSLVKDAGPAMAARQADYEANARKNAASYRAAAITEGGGLENIPIGQGAGGGFLTLGGVLMRLAERNQRMKAYEAAQQQYGPAALARAQMMSELDKLGSQGGLRYTTPEYNVNNVPVGSPLSLGNQ